VRKGSQTNHISTRRTLCCRLAAALSACRCPAQELEGVSLPDPERWTRAFLRQFPRLRTLSLFDDEPLADVEREAFVDILPSSLERLRMTAVSAVQVASPSPTSVLHHRTR